MQISEFKELLRASFKSEDTEEWLDVYFTRPIGLFFALIWKRLGVHPNAITVLSIFLGLGAAYMFYHTDLAHNILGVILLMFANFCDSTDGQLARLTGKKTLVGRVLDGFAGDVWFFGIYLAIILRLYNQNIPGTDMNWGIWGIVLTVTASLLCHSPQSSLADYYRQIHLFFLKGKEGSELDSYAQQRAIYDKLPKRGALLERLFYYNYANYCKSQERRTPIFQKFFKSYINTDKDKRDKIRDMFLAGSRPLMKYTNILTFNIRALLIYVTCLCDCVWVYLFIEITVMSCIYVYMHKSHESLCENIIKEIINNKETR